MNHLTPILLILLFTSCNLTFDQRVVQPVLSEIRSDFQTMHRASYSDLPMRIDGVYVDSAASSYGQDVAYRSVAIPLMLYSNGACRRAWSTYQNIEDFEHARRNMNRADEQKKNGFYWITGDTLEAWLPVRFAWKRVSHWETVICHFKGVIRDSATIADWQMVEPEVLPTYVEKNQSRLEDLKTPTVLKFIPTEEVPNEDHSHEWLLEQLGAVDL